MSQSTAQETYSRMISDLVHSGKDEFGSLDAEMADNLAWAKFQAEQDSRSAEIADSALACVAGWAESLKRGDMHQFKELLREGMSHCLADEIQGDIDQAAEAKRFNDNIDSINGAARQRLELREERKAVSEGHEQPDEWLRFCEAVFWLVVMFFAVCAVLYFATNEGVF